MVCAGTDQQRDENGNGRFGWNVRVAKTLENG
jgi:hypothetical protein